MAHQQCQIDYGVHTPTGNAIGAKSNFKPFDLAHTLQSRIGIFIMISVAFRWRKQTAIQISMKTQTLNIEKIDQAYGLIRLVASQISLDSWRDFASSLISPFEPPESGILTVEDERGYILGLVGYVVDRDLEHSRTLMAKNFIALDGIDRRKKDVAFALIKALEDLARNKQCRAIRTIVHEPEAALRDAWIIEVLKGAGHHTEARRFIKAVEVPG